MSISNAILYTLYCIQVEASLLELQQQVQIATAAKSQLETDNLALYERIRYLQSYGTTTATQQKVNKVM